MPAGAFRVLNLYLKPCFKFTNNTRPYRTGFSTQIFDKIRERTKIPVPYSKGEICKIIIKDNPDLKGKGGHWCIVGDVYEFSCQVLTWDGEFIMKPENLKSLDMLEDDSAAMQELCSRLRRLNSIEKIDDIERSILQAMGKRTKPLTPVQEEVLTLIEKAYGVG